MLVVVFFSLLAAALCVGPTVVSLCLAARGAGVARLVYAAAALVVALPFALVMVSGVTSTVHSFDGYCHHAPDIRYPCSLPRAIVEGISPMPPFALFGYLMVGTGSFLWGCLVLASASWLVHLATRR